MKYSVLLSLLVISVLAGCNYQANNQKESTPNMQVQKKLIEPVKRQTLTGNINYNEENVKEALDLVKELLK